MRASEPLPKIMERDFKLTRTKLGRYFLHVPIHVEVRRSKNQAPPPPLDDDVVREAVFIDPGVCMFEKSVQTGLNCFQHKKRMDYVMCAWSKTS